MVLLVVPIADGDDMDFGDVDWQQCAATQVLPEYANFSDADEGDMFAMEDRNSLASEWPGRKVFIGFGGDCVYVFNENGILIDEPDEGVRKGCQAFSEGEDHFQGDVSEGYYRFAQQQQQQQTPAAPGFDAVVVEGARVKMAFLFGEGGATAWFGALVGRVLVGEDVELAFDDGDLKRFSMVDLRKDFDASMLLPLESAWGGLVANEAGGEAAAGFVRVKDGTKLKSAGVLLDKSDRRLVFGMPVYMSFRVAKDMLGRIMVSKKMTTHTVLDY